MNVLPPVDMTGGHLIAMHAQFYSIEPQDLQRFLSWGEQLSGPRRKEAEETLREEGLRYEAMYWITTPNQNEECIFFLSDVKGRPANLERAINREHKELFQYLTPMSRLPLMGDLKLLYELRTPPDTIA